MLFTVCYSPSEELSFTNYVYVNPDDYDSEFVEIGNIPYRAQMSHAVPPNFIALNAIQRRAVNRNAGEPVEVTNIDRDFHSASELVFSIETLKRYDRTLRVNYASLRALFEDEYMESVFTRGQKHCFVYGDVTILATCRSEGRNIVTENTVFDFISYGDIDLI